MTDYTSCGSVTLSGIDARCDVSFGGIKRILVGLRDDFNVGIAQFLRDAGEAVTPIPNEDELITKIEKLGTESQVFHEFLFRRNTASYTSTVSPDAAIGNSFVTTELTLQFSKAEQKKRMIIQSLINAGAVVIIEDMYGQYIFLGLDREVVVTNGVMQSGTAESDLNGFTLTLSDISLELPHFINTKNTIEVDGQTITLDDNKWVNIENLKIAGR